MTNTDLSLTGERQQLALPLHLEEGAPSVYIRSALSIISALIITLLVWANIAHIREASVAPGEIIPLGSTRPVAHLEGGIVAEIFVSPGQTVNAGDPILRMRPESGNGEFERYEARRANLLIRAERLSAQAEGKTPDFDQFKDRWASLVVEQRAIYASTISEHEANARSLSEQIEFGRAEVTNARAEFTAKTEQLNIAEEQYAIQEKLIEGGYTSKQSFLDAKTALSAAKAALAAATARREQADRNFSKYEADYQRLEAKFKNDSAEERAIAVAELAELAQPIISLEDRADRLTVRAPVGGVIQEIVPSGNGAVIPSGSIVAEIVPADADLVAEIRIDPKDIGHISAGQLAEVTVTAFDANRYGKVNGTIGFITPDTFIDERTGLTYYKATVSLESDTIGAGKFQRALTAGMVVQVQIVTQTRSVMEYILKPVVRSLDNSFTES